MVSSLEEHDRPADREQEVAGTADTARAAGTTDTGMGVDSGIVGLLTSSYFFLGRASVVLAPVPAEGHHQGGAQEGGQARAASTTGTGSRSSSVTGPASSGAPP